VEPPRGLRGGEGTRLKPSGLTTHRENAKVPKDHQGRFPKKLMGGSPKRKNSGGRMPRGGTRMVLRDLKPDGRKKTHRKLGETKISLDPGRKK